MKNKTLITILLDTTETEAVVRINRRNAAGVITHIAKLSINYINTAGVICVEEQDIVWEEY